METAVSFADGGFIEKGMANGTSQKSDAGKDYSDDEDDVYVEDPLLADSPGATKPLMYPRQRARVKSRHPRCKCRYFVRPMITFLLIVIALGGLSGGIVYLLNYYSNPGHHHGQSQEQNLMGCDHIDISDVWVVQLPKLLTESAFRLMDVNQDGVIDVVFGFATELPIRRGKMLQNVTECCEDQVTSAICSVRCRLQMLLIVPTYREMDDTIERGADGYNIPDVVCDIYFDSVKPCLGGVIALDGKSGKELWRYWAEHELYGINCNADLNTDGINDCLAGGRGAAFHAISGKDGSKLWDFGQQEAKNAIMNMYTAHITADLDNDGVVDVLAIHGGDPLQAPGSKYRLSGRILLISGKTGKVIRWAGVPDKKESYYSPQIYHVKDGLQMVLFGTGGETHGGSLWSIGFHDLFNGAMDKAFKIYEDPYKGIMVPPVLLDLTGDNVEDIVMSLFNSTVIAIDGQTYKPLWNYTFPQSESYVTPAVGYFNDDNIPDFLVKYAYGPGYPVYYHSQTTVLDGRTGQPLVHPFIRDTVGSQASAVTISFEGYGNDIFLYWLADCLGHEGQGGEFSFVNGTKVFAMSRANFCKLRFKSKGFSKIMALGGDIKSPGQVIYYSEERKNTEHAAWINTTKEAIDFMKKHPEYKADYYRYKHLERTSTMPTIETQQRQSAEEYYQPLSVDSPRLSAKKGPGYEGRNKHVNRKGYDNNLYGQEDGKSANRYRPAYSDARNYNDAYNKGVYDDGDSQYDALYPNNRKFSQINSGYDTGDADDVNLFDYLRQHIPPEYLYKKQSFPETPRQNDRTQPRYQNSKLSHQSATKRFPPPYKRSLSASEAELKIPRNADDLLQRKRRHIGPHDNSGLQRLISTGTLAPTTLPTSHSDFNRSIDYIFGVYWFFPVKSQAILPEDQKCIANKMAEETIRFNKDSKYYGLDHDGYEHKITDECLDKNGNKEKDNSKYRHQNSYNPYDLKMGQMTVYRMRLICRCNQTSANLAGKKCATVLPFEQQQWPAYMGRDADSHWLPRIIKQTKSNNDS